MIMLFCKKISLSTFSAKRWDLLAMCMSLAMKHPTPWVMRIALSDSSLNGCLKAAGSRSFPVNSLPSFLCCQLSAQGDASAEERTCLTCCYWHKQHTRTMFADCRTFVNNFLTAVILGHSKCKVVPYSRLIPTTPNLHRLIRPPLTDAP